MIDLTIVAGGWSVRNVLLDRLVGTVMGVNEAAFRIPRADIVLSMDRLWTEYRWPWMQERRGETWLRRSAVQNLDIKRPVADGWLHVFECDNNSAKFAAREGWLNGTNSGTCALNLAWRMKPRRLFLLGFDMNRDPQGRAHWHPPHPWTNPQGGTSNANYAKWAKELNAAALLFGGAGIEVFNVSPSSAITVFPKISPAEYARLAE
jgi:hypothetical protein